MKPASLARALGLARIAFGLGLIAQPERLATPWIGREAKGPGAQVAVRGLGARDLVLGAGAAVSSGGDRQRWLAAGIVGDVADLTATLAAGRALPLRGRVLVGTVASAGIAMGGAALAGLRR
ncbi:MAG TPA: hypothetical protein VG405_10235 [Solirubrobacteraceae bacterium]|nr:hypothetical protein [Solirubrobacteraceae bacterium]